MPEALRKLKAECVPYGFVWITGEMRILWRKIVLDRRVIFGNKIKVRDACVEQRSIYLQKSM